MFISLYAQHKKNNYLINHTVYLLIHDFAIFFYFWQRCSRDRHYQFIIFFCEFNFLCTIITTTHFHSDFKQMDGLTEYLKIWTHQIKYLYWNIEWRRRICFCNLTKLTIHQTTDFKGQCCLVAHFTSLKPT